MWIPEWSLIQQQHHVTFFSIETPLLNHTGRACIHFAYSMYGDHIGTLAATINRPESSRLLLGQSGSEGQEWNSYHQDIDELGSKAKVSIQRKLRYHWDAV